MNPSKDCDVSKPDCPEGGECDGVDANLPRETGAVRKTQSRSSSVGLVEPGGSGLTEAHMELYRRQEITRMMPSRRMTKLEIFVCTIVSKHIHILTEKIFSTESDL